jgi:hypothetical protein
MSSRRVGEVVPRLGEEHQARRLEPSRDGLYGQLTGRRRIEHPGMRDDGEEFVNARPRDCPRSGAGDEPLQGVPGGLVPLHLLAVRVDEEVGVDRDQPPRPS